MNYPGRRDHPDCPQTKPYNIVPFNSAHVFVLKASLTMQIPTDEQVLRLKAQTLKARGLEPLEHILRAGKRCHIGERAGWPDRTTQANL